MLGLPEVTSKDILDLTAMKAGAPKEIAKEVIENAKTVAATAAGRAEAALEKPGVSFTMKDVDQVRKQIVTLMGDAKRAAMAPGGSFADVRALGHILDQFENRVEQMIASGKFRGDGAEALAKIREARDERRSPIGRS
jgi:glucosamine 6-phosphate synthetase-like amidotransferase/phosphosugar isomerase protein